MAAHLEVKPARMLGLLRTLKVGMVASLSGSFSEQGRQALQGAMAWIQEVNRAGGIPIKELGRKLSLEMTYYDDEGKIGAAKKATEQLIARDRVDVLLGPYSSGLTVAAACVAEEFRRVLWNHGGASDRVNKQGFSWVVSILTPASKYMLGIIDLLREADFELQTMAIVSSASGSFSSAVASGATDYALAKGFDVVFTGRYGPRGSDFSPLIREIKGLRPDIILGAGRIEEDLSFAQQLIEKRLEAKAVALVAAPLTRFKETLRAYASGFMGPSQWEPGVRYMPDYGPSVRDWTVRLHDPGIKGGDYPMAQAYAAGLVVERCLKEAGTLDNQALRQTAAKLDFTTFYGRFRIDPVTGCQIGHSMVVVEWQKGWKPIVWPKDMRQADWMPYGQAH
ncbi:MAG: amino acid ABC transporter substrate-binding protein [Deltaproteobacteria bacterium]|nr:amino acid ABC transporter substrate-binding protein [Deltaproteobacteria bacterium]